MNVHSSFIHSCPNLETTQMSFSGWMDKQTVVINTMESCLLKTTNYWFIKKKAEHGFISLSKRMQMQNITFWRRQNYRDGKHTLVSGHSRHSWGRKQGAGGLTLTGWGTFRSVGTILYSVLVEDLSKPIDLHNTMTENYCI